MLGMSFLSFLTLTIIAFVVAAVYHWALHASFLDRIDAAFGKLVIGWIGGWVGSPVLGHWLWKYENVYIVPAILGAIATVHLTVLAVRTFAPTTAMKPAITEAAARAKTASAA